MAFVLCFKLIVAAQIILGRYAQVACGFQENSTWRRQLRVRLRQHQQLRSSSSVDRSSIPPQTSQQQVPDMEAYSRGYQTVYQELPYKLCQPSFGQIPNDLVGTYFRCGPAMFSAGSIIPPRTSIIKPKKPPVPDGQDPLRTVTHPFEGDGAVVAITFSGGTSKPDATSDTNSGSNVDNFPTVRFRYVRTTGFTNERKRGERLYKSMDSTRLLGPTAGGGLGNELSLPLFRHHLQPGLNKNRKNTANTRVVYWAKRLLTLWEGGLPYKLDALALSTEGKSQLGGVLYEDDPFGAKMVVDPVRNRAIFYRNTQDATSSELTLFEFDSNFRLIATTPQQQQNKDGAAGKVTTKLPGLALLSDFAATSQYAIFVQPSVSVNPVQFLVNKEPGKVIAVDANKPATLHLIPRWGSNKSIKSIPLELEDGKIDADWQFCNAYEEEGSNGNRIVVDVIRPDGTDSVEFQTSQSWPWVTTTEEFTQQHRKKSLWRYVVHVDSGSVQKTQLSNVHCGFGVVNPSKSTLPHRFVYMAIGNQGSNVAPLQGLCRFDCEKLASDVWLPECYEFCGEPMFAPRQPKQSDQAASMEDDGYILSILLNGKTVESELVVLRASDLSAGPIARVPLGIAIPHGLFGCYSPDASWSHDEIQRRAKLADKMESRGSMWNEVKSDFSGLGLRLDDIEEILGI